MIELRLALSDEQVAALADQVAARLAADNGALTTSAEPLDGWLDTRQAASYLGLTLHAIHKLTAARAVPFEQQGPGCRCWFRRSELDAWVRAGRPAKRPLRAA